MGFTNKGSDEEKLTLQTEQHIDTVEIVSNYCRFFFVRLMELPSTFQVKGILLIDDPECRYIERNLSQNLVCIRKDQLDNPHWILKYFRESMRSVSNEEAQKIKKDSTSSTQLEIIHPIEFYFRETGKVESDVPGQTNTYVRGLFIIKDPYLELKKFKKMSCYIEIPPNKKNDIKFLQDKFLNKMKEVKE